MQLKLQRFQLAQSCRFALAINAAVFAFTFGLANIAFGQVDFNREIQPILSSKCFTCHGPDEASREAGLRLDREADAHSELDSGVRALVPSDVEASELYYRITTDDESLRMPPAESGEALNADEQRLIKEWIEQGASYELHWAFDVPRKSSVPAVDDPAWNQNPIDQFIYDNLLENGLSPADRADRETLIRRVALTLTGLPPTIEDIDQFVQDDHPEAYARMVDRYLDSPAYGERWAAMWLDLARYADSQGYAQDTARTIWRYRDWVIDAFNRNLSYDQFTIEQLAGDLLESPTEDQLLATAFHRNTMTNSEGGTDDEEFRSAAVVDRVNTTLEVWMGLTIGCAQCHTHKYDPLSQEEYYQLYAIFNQTADTDHPSDKPFLPSFSENRLKQRAQLESQLKSIREQLKLTGQTQNETVQLPKRSGPLSIKRLRFQSVGEATFLHLAEVEAFRNEVNIAPRAKATQISTDFGGEVSRAIDGNRDGDYDNAKSTSHTARENNPWLDLTWDAPQKIDTIQVWNRTDNAGVRDRLKHLRVTAYNENDEPIWTADFAQTPNPDASFKVPTDFESMTEQERASIDRLARELHDPAYELKQKLADLNKRLDGLKEDILTPIMEELPTDQLRETHIHIRGDFRSPGQRVGPDVPEIFGRYELAEEQQFNRLQFARWLVHPQNPLTARVTVNRFWEQVFGVGIVETSEDFGTQGQLPSHPELLDYLAVEFVEDGWDVKALLRRMVMSETFRQSSAATELKLERDPYNHLLSRGPRFRLTAEQIRDQALFAAGQLSRKMKGPSVRPPRPNLGIRAAFGGSTDWETSPGEDQYRRALYTSWRRTSPYPSLTTFDATSREICTIRRIRTNTPLQALVTMNDPVYVEAAQALARRLVASEASDRERFALAMRLVLARHPQPSEYEIAERYVSEAKSRYQLDLGAAEQMATNPIGPVPEGMDTVDLAAWTVMCNVLLNLDEAISPR